MSRTGRTGRRPLAWVAAPDVPIGATPLDVLSSIALRALVGHVALMAASIAAACALLAARSVPYLGLGYGSMVSTAVSYATTSPSVGLLAALLATPVALMSVALAARSCGHSPAGLAVSRACALSSAAATSLIAWAALCLCGLALGGGQLGRGVVLALATAAMARLAATDLGASGLGRMPSA